MCVFFSQMVGDESHGTIREKSKKQQEIQEHWEQKCYTPLKDYQPPADPSIIT